MAETQRNSPERADMLAERAAEQRARGDRLQARRRKRALDERRYLERIAREMAAKKIPPSISPAFQRTEG